LFTQCSKCDTVFRLSAEVLRAAGGQVRCGRCGEVFNALARLAEEPTGFASAESPLDLEARADSILQTEILQTEATLSPAAESAPQDLDDLPPPGTEIAHLKILDVGDNDAPAPRAPGGAAESDAESSLEFTLPPGELDRIFVEVKPRAPLPIPLETPADSGAERAAADPAFEEARRRLVGIEVPEEVRRDMLAGFEQAMLPQLAAPSPRRRSFIVWLGAAVVLIMLLSAQMVHENREWLAARGPLGASLRALYSKLGAALPAPANLSSYQLRQWGVTGDPGANGTLRVRASILNTANQLQPYPLLRVTLANRFGNRIGARDFEPAEYLGKAPNRMLGAGERVDATLDILDPGKNAEGFEIDVCLRGADRRIACANDAAAQAKK
jgi:predicted Zn finger-like uncharacterized protein